MAARPRTRVIAAPNIGTPVNTSMGSYRRVAAPGSPVPIAPPLQNTAVAAAIADAPPPRDVMPDNTEDDAWEAEVRRREASEGIVEKAVAAPFGTPTADREHPIQWTHPQVRPLGTQLVTSEFADLTGLPEQFTLQVERKGEFWKVTAPTVHVGLFVANGDLAAALMAAPVTLAEILRLDGPRPVGRRRNAR